LFETVRGAVGPRTKILSLSHVTFTTGTCLLVGTIGRFFEERAILFVVDGVHPPGMLQPSPDGLTLDFYVSSPHKWLLAPQGTGFLFLAEPWRRDLWPTLASGGWDDKTLAAHRFNHLGTFDESKMAGLLAAVESQRALRSDRIEARIRFLRRWMRLSNHVYNMSGEIEVVVDLIEGAARNGVPGFQTPP
jgi:selenocysteine lyase/cysteine desulfurase